MINTDQLPLYELTRGGIVESIHYGSIAVSDNQGRLVGWYGDPHTKTFLRSSAKPFQALPFIELNGRRFFDLSPEEVALICASHSGTDRHVSTIQSIQKKTGVSEPELMCGTHPAFDEATAQAMWDRKEEFSPNRHNCSGKHTGMLAFAHMQNWSTSDYLEPDHKIQSSIRGTFSEMSGVPMHEIVLGVDGCSAPNFAIPLHNSALAFARLCGPENFSPERAAACRTITSSMMGNPFMVGGPGRFDTRIMEVTSGKVVSKGGAEGYQALGIMPGTLGVDSPALGVAFKISDGDLRSRARPAISIEILRQLNALTPEQVSELSEFGPSRALKNWRGIEVGEAITAFQLNLI